MEMFPTGAAGCRPCEVGVAREAVGGACKGAGAAMGLGGCTVGEASAAFGGTSKRVSGGGVTTGRETRATGAGAALVGAAMGGDAVGMRGAERRD